MAAVELLQRNLDADFHEILNVVPTASGSATHTDLATGPTAVGTQATGTSLLAAPADHSHAGVHGISQDGGAVATGDINLVSGTGVTVARVGQNITFSSTATATKISLAEDAAAYMVGTVEEIIREWYVSFDEAAAGNITATLSAIVKVNDAATIGTYKLRVGATAPGATTGSTVRATFTSGSATEELKTNTGSAFTNPTGKKLVQLTATNDTALKRSYIRGLQISIG